MERGSSLGCACSVRFVVWSASGGHIHRESIMLRGGILVGVYMNRPWRGVHGLDREVLGIGCHRIHQVSG